MSFKDLKKQSKTSFDKLNEQLKGMEQAKGSVDDRFWKLTVDKAGNGYAIIRFLPAPDGEDMPFVRMWDHGFQGQGGWYIENSLTTLGLDDPVSEYNTKLWNSGSEANKDIARKQKRRLSFYSNIYVVKDSANPDNEGKVFLYKFGKKIFDMVNDAMNPSYEDEVAMNPFDMWEGADFKLKARQVDGYRNYDKSEFSSPSVVTDAHTGEKMDDEALEALWKQEHSVAELVDKSNFKSYNELKTKLYKVLGVAPDSTVETEDNVTDFTPKFKEKEADEPAKAEDDGDDDLAYFRDLAKG
jgi:hypothetical protein